MYSPFSFFIDPVLRAPTIGCMLMSLTASMIGVVIFLRKQVLAGETLSHASYPGVIIGILLAGFFSVEETDELRLALFTLTGAFTTSLVGVGFVQFLEKKIKVTSDAALCFVLSTFFGVGLMLTSEVQFTYTSLYKQISTYLYGQAATMTDIHIMVYGSLLLVVITIISWLYKEIQILTFDRQYAKSLGIHVRTIEILIFILLTLTVIIGIRSVGVVLMSAMLVAPAVAARQFTNKFSMMLILSGFFGLLSGFLGNYLSVQITDLLASYYPSSRLVLPTGPMIVIVASFICLLALLFAPERGLLIRLIRIGYFHYECTCENLLKTIWRLSPDIVVRFDQLIKYQPSSPLYLIFVLHRMKHNGWIQFNKDNTYQLTQDGQLRAAKIIRLHRLWEVYLVEYLGARTERVHHNAEEMEHILTPELEKELTELLHDPKHDPHRQPIPSKEGMHVV
ncbi:metal ABC transporter permease [Candidatus Protochlamydia sp. W-9]|uniref:metal ABC transporter permease n=1 Tax=Candidatus Protochlamydia sp. W-9 TaxID=1785087 RepID=UPI00096A7B2A|nr:iron chelate uptake ABC transporter family permease subunit [Candidatus Protochlamydia sp. W-9]